MENQPPLAVDHLYPQVQTSGIESVLREGTVVHVKPAVVTTASITKPVSVNKSGQSDSETPTTVADPNQSTQQKSPLRKMVKCRFFFSEKGCSQGNTCKFSHAIDMIENEGELNTKAVAPLNNTKPKEKVRVVCKFYSAGYCKWGNRCGFFHSQSRTATAPKSQNSTKNSLDSKKLSEMEDSELKGLRKTEIAQLKKRFPKRTDVDNCTYRLVFRPHDPDWPFDVKTLNLELSFPDLYPKHIMSANIYDLECLPPVLARHICKKMNDWLTDRHVACQKADKAELIFRPFLRWLDKALEQMFTDGLMMFKRELSAKAAGFTFVSHTTAVKPSDDLKENITESGGEIQSGEVLTTDVESLSISEEVETENSQAESAVSPPSPTPQTSSRKLDPMRRGTELRLRNLQLLESLATLHCTILRIGIRCTRCKTVHHVSLHPSKPYVIVCDKCRTKMSIIYHANLMHIGTNTVGFFDLDCCQPFDLIMPDCQLVAGCLECGKDLPVHGLHPEQTKQFWCINCHKKMALSAERGSYIVLNAGAAIKIGADAVLIAKKAKPKSELRILAEGKQLPDKGACLHYKKSFRWFRFPCCGKLYPCDKCHDEKETDHEMDMANRMVCGYCSKEQGFSLTKPCVNCDSSMTRAKSQHWEGGQGCRNKIAMAKTDKQKFVGSNKTVSKKAEAAQKKTGKKTTHVRHAV